ncbi:helix-turn-helix domain-containing protein [Levilactobacillus fujinensis]|uniref:Helix-turn-helix domain-containing protein n=1 Tax=Levilactobacillus fujinensis TaxID=2486024 RepID=A0ABW1THA5_9LACO|nr:helix-turn-helix transcriptional regulator [Levilactobacillus fujinensis]
MTNADFSALVSYLGQHLQHERQRQGISLAQVATGLCPIGQVKAIEGGLTIPAPELLTSLCRRLKLPLQQLTQTGYVMRRQLAFSQRVETLARRQQPVKLMTYLDNRDRLATLRTDRDLQVYYYYYGCSVFQATGDTRRASQYFQTTLTLMTPQHPRCYQSLELVTLATQNYIEMLAGRTDDAGFTLAVKMIREDRVLDSHAGISTIYYLYAATLFRRGQANLAGQILQEGVKWAVQHQTSARLADDFGLLATHAAAVKSVSS